MPINNAKEVPIQVVGSSKFGLYPKISDERTYNMFVSDEWMINYSGFQKIAQITDGSTGRGLFHSIRGNFAIGVIGSVVYKFSGSMAPVFIGQINTSRGEVSIDENLSRQICIVDGENAYIYDYDDTQTLTPQVGTAGWPIAGSFVPGYVTYQNTFFLIASAATSLNPEVWWTFTPTTGDSTSTTANTMHTLQTKPDSALAIKRLPGRGNNAIVFGSSVAEVWQNVGGAENYRRNASFNIDSGAVSINTIAASEDTVCWLGKNENNAPAIMVTDGSNVKRISTDGIDGLMQNIVRPDKSTAFFYRQDGHLFYQLTFFDSQDNLTLIYDFNTGMFFDIMDEKENFHPARQVIYFDEKTYFVSINDASIYQMGTQFTTYNYDIDPLAEGKLIPRVRICNTVRIPNSDRFIAKRFAFWIEQGVNNYNYSTDEVVCTGYLLTEDGDRIITETGDFILAQGGYCVANNKRPRVEMSVSKDGNQSYSNRVARYLNKNGHYRNQITWDRIGQANEFTVQLRFEGLSRFVVNQGTLWVAQ